MFRAFEVRNGPKSTLLTKINRDVPSGIDWRHGAVDYVAAQFARDGRAAIERYCLSKPFRVAKPRRSNGPHGNGSLLL